MHAHISQIRQIALMMIAAGGLKISGCGGGEDYAFCC